MNKLWFMLYVQLKNLMNRKEGQDMVEYALIAAILSLAAIVFINGAAGSGALIFLNISGSLAGAA